MQQYTIRYFGVDERPLKIVAEEVLLHFAKQEELEPLKTPTRVLD